MSAARGPPSRGQARAAPVTRPPLSGRQVLLFHASACNELTPPLHRAPPGQQAGSPLTEGTPPRRAFVPGVLRSPGFDAIVPPIDASAVVHARSSSHRIPDPLTAGLFLQRSPPRLLTGAACSGLGSPPARRTRRTCLHHWHSTVHSATFYIASLPFRTHRRSAVRGRRWDQCSLPSVGGQPRRPLLSSDAEGDLQEAASRPALAKSLRRPVIADGHAPEDHVLALQHGEALPLEEAPG